MVNATPVVATRAVDIPEYLGELGIYIDGSSASIVDAVLEIESGRRDLIALGSDLRAKALRTTPAEGYYLLGLKFSRPLLPSTRTNGTRRRKVAAVV